MRIEITLDGSRPPAGSVAVQGGSAATPFSGWLDLLAALGELVGAAGDGVTLTTFLVPFIATLIAWALLAEVPPALTFVGGGLAIVGVLLTRRRPRAPRNA